MAIYETLSLDGLAITGDPTGTLILEQFQAPVPKAKSEWIGAADSEWQALARSPLHENREITLRIRVKQQASTDAALDQIAAVRDKLRKASLTDDGVPMTWSPTNSTRTVTFDVLHGEITDLPIEANGDGYGWLIRTPVFTVVLSAKPYWYGTETLSSTATNATPLQTLEIAGVAGDIPALGRLIVTDAATQSRRFVEWGLEAQNYNAATSLILTADNLTVTGFAGTMVTATLFYDPNATGTNAIRFQPTTMPIAMGGTGAQSHVGTFRVVARFTSQSVSTHRIRFVWRVGDGPYTAGPWVAPADGWSELELTTITIPKAVTGTQRWDGRIEVFDDTGDTSATPTNLDLNYLILMPAAEGYGQARATYRYVPGVLVARDEFTGTTAGSVLNARVAPLGGTWTTAGATTDFVFADATNQERIQRATTSDAVSTLGRYATLGSTNYTDTEVGMRLWRSTAVLTNSGVQQGLIARFVDSSNYMLFRFQPGATSTTAQVISILTVVAGSVSVSRTKALSAVVWANLWHRMRLVVFASGYAIGTLMDDNGNTIERLEFRDPALATGGALATGKPGLMEINPSVTVTLTRLYDDFYVSTPTAEPMAIYSGRAMEIRHDTVLRQDSGGTYYGRPPSYRGSRFTLQPGTNRVAVRSRRSDVASSDASAATDSTTIQVGVTPRGLVVPR